MHKQKFSAEELRINLLRLDSDRMLVFGLLCAERMFPNCIAFQNESGWGDMSKVRDALVILFRAVSGQKPSFDDVVMAAEACELQAPSSDDFDSIFVTAAQDVCFSICCLMDFLNSPDVSKIVQVATYSTDSIDLYVQEAEKMRPDDPHLEEKILLHPLMQTELETQDRELSALLAAPSLNEELVDNLRSDYAGKGMGTLRALPMSS